MGYAGCPRTEMLSKSEKAVKKKKIEKSLK
jgi:hypothetical protein